MTKRASTNYSFLVGVDKPAGMSSHDVVNTARRIYGERRIGHTGTLDPAATGALLLCVGPATRLDRFIVGHSKVYEFSCVFGTQTTTDDAEGEVIAHEHVPAKVCDETYAQEVLTWMLGPAEQLPPAYSAIKVAGTKAYEAARAGKALNLAPRPVEIYALELLSLEAHDPKQPVWHIKAHVSAGTYIRSLARDLGALVGTCAHVGKLQRTSLGRLSLESCVSLHTLEKSPFDYILDPLKLLDIPFAFPEAHTLAKVANGAAIGQEELELYEYDKASLVDDAYCMCTSGSIRLHGRVHNNEIVGIIENNTLRALYSFNEQKKQFVSSCGFAIGVQRGARI